MENNQVPATKALFLRVTIDSGYSSLRHIVLRACYGAPGTDGAYGLWPGTDGAYVLWHARY
eukprot:3292841-Rhodomonas_salina.1